MKSAVFYQLVALIDTAVTAAPSEAATTTAPVESSNFPDPVPADVRTYGPYTYIAHDPE